MQELMRLVPKFTGIYGLTSAKLEVFFPGPIPGRVDDKKILDIKPQFQPVDGIFKFRFSLTGSNNNDVISGELGDDLLAGSAGNDALFGGAGLDQLFGGAGNDQLVPGDFLLGVPFGRQIADGGAGVDTLDLIDTPFPMLALADLSLDVVNFSAFLDIPQAFIDAPNIENVSGTARADRLFGDFDANRLIGRDGIDVLRGRGGNDRLFGDGDDDAEFAGGGLFGGDGDDVLDGGPGDDDLFGEGQDDALTGGPGADFLYGGEGTDVAVFLNSAGVTADLTTGRADDGAGIDTLVDIENVQGSTLADTLIGNDGPNVLSGVAGGDTLSGGADRDVMECGFGSDTCRFDDGDAGIGPSADAVRWFDDPDVLDLMEIDARLDVDGDQAFEWIGLDQFTGAGQLRLLTAREGNAVVQGNLDNAELGADLEIVLLEAFVTPTADDFML